MGPNLQDSFLADCKLRASPVVLQLMNASVLVGIVKGFDSFTVLLEVESKAQLVYKHAIATISL